MRIGEYASGGISTRNTTLQERSKPLISPTVPASVVNDVRQIEIEALLRLGIGKPTIARAATMARHNGTSIERELLANRWVDAESYYAALARALRLPFLSQLDPALIHDDQALDTQLADTRSVRLNYADKAMIAIVPEAGRLLALARTIEGRPGLAERIIVTTPTAMRDAIWRVGAKRRVKESIGTLFEDKGRFSARIVLSGKQGFVAGAVLCALIFAAFSDLPLIAILHLALSFIYMAAILLRACALHHRRGPQPTPQPTERLPVYSVFVALYKEAEVAGQLVAALKQLNWPTAKLDIKLICEADDHATIAALEKQDLGPQFEIIAVPVSHPRTKPKALNYALSAARGEFLVIYDAEDRPHPDQLRAAYAGFCASRDDVACLQAPLIISNVGASWISAAFALEYAALFRLLLPMLAKHRLPMPLGGTSNHLRVADLKACGGWDPYNVTEDADLGLRLYRLGYRCGVIDCPTYEDAPTTRKVWLNQRTRWFKGWLQTWLVMMRAPGKLVREMGIWPFLAFQVLVGGMLVASLTHPWMVMLIITTASYMMLGFPETATLDALLFLIDVANMLGSYVILLVLGRRAMLRDEKRKVGWRWVALPVYWMMISGAAWRAVFQLHFKPFFWDKTPHLPTSQPMRAASVPSQ
ncbi:glycosyltransferase family 2 protein [Rhizobium sp. S163]|uniref:glycosyltransferase family 2 protein n=1 Tax=Rhizobium sp. S163 TaxID=3055039 RepID=UPI0025AA2EC8|nr:glycosyltransferase family 2 protein [Rhizobium sp. S163]MDM9647303.1 glycosyltransferase family 2 protein [Rhizobium sp. S163]